MSANVATLPELRPIFGWQAWILDVVVQGVIDRAHDCRTWFTAELSRPAPLLPRPELAVPDPEPEPVGLRRSGRYFVPAADGRACWLAPWLLTGVELAWNALPPGVPPRIDRGRAAGHRLLCRLLEWIPRPSELARDRHCRLVLEGAALMLLLAWLLPPVALAGVAVAALLVVLVAPRLLAIRLPSRAVLAIRWRWFWRTPPCVTGTTREGLAILAEVRAAREHGTRRAA